MCGGGGSTRQSVSPNSEHNHFCIVNEVVGHRRGEDRHESSFVVHRIFPMYQFIRQLL